jgi:hypothetical protein
MHSQTCKSFCAPEPLRSAAAEQAVAVDRFARKIVPFLKSFCAARSRQLNGGRWVATILLWPAQWYALLALSYRVLALACYNQPH